MIDVLVFVLAQYRGTLTVGDRTEVRARLTDSAATSTAATSPATTSPATTSPATTSTLPIYDTSTQPTATAVLDDRRWQHSLFYSPIITQRGDIPLGTLDVLHQGSVRTTWRSKRVRLTLSEAGNYGTRTYSDLTGAGASTTAADGSTRPPAPLQLVPAGSLRVGSSTTALSSIVALARRWSLATTETYTLSGGLNDVGELLIPPQRIARFENTLTYTMDRRDRIFTTVAPQVAQFPRAPCQLPPLTTSSSAPLVPLCDRRLDLIDVSEGWTHQWTRRTSTTILLGADFRHVRLDRYETYRNSVGPIGAATLSHVQPAPPGQLRLQLITRIGPVIDQRIAVVETRTDEMALAEWIYVHTSLRGTAQYTQSVPATAGIAVRAFQVEARVTQRLGVRFDVEGGYRSIWQEQQGQLFRSSNAFVALVYHEPPILF
jgi:hypothetical protein